MHPVITVRSFPVSFPYARNGGFGLIELMVAMAISLLLLSGVVAIFMSSRTSYETTDRLSRIQENGRFALDQLVEDVRAAGFVGCARVPTYVSTTLSNATDVKWNFLDSAVRGYQFASAGTYSPTLAAADVPSAADGSDVLLVRRPKRDSLPLRLLADQGASTADLTVPNTTGAGLAVNDIALIYSCEAQTYFQVTGFAGGTIAHAAGAAVAETATTSAGPGNATNDLSYSFRRNAEVIPMETVIYYVRASTAGPAGSTSLWRKIGSNTAEELVEGVEQMQLRFGVDTTLDGVVDGAYRTADAVGAANWNNVYSVEIGLLVRSLDGYGGDRDTETYQLLDVLVPAANDTRMRELFTVTTGIRNRIRVN
jgi:type IV pilus assembly protein PilW